MIPAGDTFTRNGAVVAPGTQAYTDIVTALQKTGIARIVAEDPTVAAMLAPYTRQVNDYRTVQVATATNEIAISLNSGPGPLATDSMLASVPNAQAAILNYGGVRRSIAAGVISVGDVLEVMPFSNTLAIVDLTGAELKQALEDGIDYLLTKYPPQDPPLMPFIGGMRFNVQISAAKGSRVSSLQVKDASGNYQPLQVATVYRTVTNAFVAGGGDGFTTMKNATGFRSDTGIIDSDAFRQYLQKLGTVSNPTEQRINVLSSVSMLSILKYGSADNYRIRRHQQQTYRI